MSDKNIIRKQILELRSNIEEKEKITKSNIIVNKVLKLEQLKSSNIVMCYMDFKNEVSTKAIILKCLDFGKKICIPFIEAGNNIIKPYYINSLDDIKIGSYRIMEPNIDICEMTNINEIDLVIVPGIAFDFNKNRVGFGHGYYDKFLSSLNEKCYKIGVAYDFQIVSEIDINKFDVAMDLIITDKNIIE